jgi:hypothetical protein
MLIPTGRGGLHCPSLAPLEFQGMPCFLHVSQDALWTFPAVFSPVSKFNVFEEWVWAHFRRLKKEFAV